MGWGGMDCMDRPIMPLTKALLAEEVLWKEGNEVNEPPASVKGRRAFGVWNITGKGTCRKGRMGLRGRPGAAPNVATP